MSSLSRSSPGGLASTAVSSLIPPALQDLTGFLSNVSYQIAALQHDVDNIKLRTGLSVPSISRDEYFAQSLASAFRAPDVANDPAQPSHGNSQESTPQNDLLSTQSAVTGLVNPTHAARDSSRMSLPSANFALPTLPEAPSVNAFSPQHASPPTSVTAPTPFPGMDPSRPSSAPLIHPSPASFASTTRPSSTRNIIVAAGDDSQIITLTQMVEQFEGRVEAGMDDVRAQLAAALQDIGACHARIEEVVAVSLPPLEAEEVVTLRERTAGLERRLETMQAGTAGASASATEAAAQAAAATEAVAAVRGDLQGALYVLQQQLDPAQAMAAAKKAQAVGDSVAALEEAAELSKASVRALEEQSAGLRASANDVQQRLSALNQRETDLERALQKASAVAKAELDDTAAALQARCAQLQEAQQGTAADAADLGRRTAALETVVGVVDANREEAAKAVARVRTAIATETSALAAGISKAEHIATSLGTRLALTEQRVNELQGGKQDAVTAVTMDMVNARVANGIEESTARAAEAALRVQELQGSVAELERGKADKAEAATAVQLQMKTQDLLETLQQSTQAMADDVERRIERKAEGGAVRSLEAVAAKRFASIEAALLKGLHTVSAKTASGLETRVSCEEYDRFRGSITGRLNDVARALTELLPTARAADSSKARGATTCLSCDQRVRSNAGVLRALTTAGALPDGVPLAQHLQRAAVPHALPLPMPVPTRKAISSADPVGACHNARLALKSRQHASLQVYQKRRKSPPAVMARPHTVGVLRPSAMEHDSAARGTENGHTAPLAR
eukprot:jgi/Ulvmu1/10920/UM007_0099.1